MLLTTDLRYKGRPKHVSEIVKRHCNNEQSTSYLQTYALDRGETG